MQKSLFCLFPVLACVIALVGCSHTTLQEDTAYGKITAVDDRTITVALGTLEASEPLSVSPPAGGEQPQGSSPAKPDASSAPTPTQPQESPAPEDAQPSQGTSADEPPQQRDGEPVPFEPSGEEVTYTITDGILLKVKGEESTLALSDLQVGMIVKITLSGSTPTSVEVWGGMGRTPAQTGAVQTKHTMQSRFS